MLPGKRGSGVVYNSKLSTDFLHQKYQSQAEKLISKYIVQGMFGWEITDIEITLTGGKFNSAGSKPSHFNIIIPIAFFRALKKSKMRRLEPVSRFKLTIPTKSLKIVINSLKKIKAIYAFEKEDLEEVILTGTVLSRRIINYNSVIVKDTGGLGFFHDEFEKYIFSDDLENEMPFYGNDPRNETKFIKTQLGGSLEMLDINTGKNKKSSRSKFKMK